MGVCFCVCVCVRIKICMQMECKCIGGLSIYYRSITSNVPQLVLVLVFECWKCKKHSGWYSKLMYHHHQLCMAVSRVYLHVANNHGPIIFLFVTKLKLQTLHMIINKKSFYERKWVLFFSYFLSLFRLASMALKTGKTFWKRHIYKKFIAMTRSVFYGPRRL